MGMASSCSHDCQDSRPPPLKSPKILSEPSPSSAIKIFELVNLSEPRVTRGKTRPQPRSLNFAQYTLICHKIPLYTIIRQNIPQYTRMYHTNCFQVADSSPCHPLPRLRHPQQKKTLQIQPTSAQGSGLWIWNLTLGLTARTNQTSFASP